MARRKESGLDAIAALPWPVGIVLGLLGFWVIRYGAGWYFAQSGGPLGDALGRQLNGGSLAPLAWFVLAVFWGAAGVSYARGRQRVQLLQTRTDLASVAALDWQHFEQLVGEAFRRQGFLVEETGQGGADGGVDLVLHKDGRTVLVQCKRWRQRQVSVTTVREMWGLLVHHGADAVKIVSVGEFTPDARRFAERKAIDLISGTALLAMIREVQANGMSTFTQPDRIAPRLMLLGQAAATTSQLPRCPACASEMMLRVNRQAGSHFWGCSTFPRCRGARPIASQLGT